MQTLGQLLDILKEVAISSFILYSRFFMPRWLHLHLIQATCAKNKNIIKTGKKQHIHHSDIAWAQQNLYAWSLYTATLDFYPVFSDSHLRSPSVPMMV